MKLRKKEKPTIVINNIVKPIRIKDNEKIILIVGDKYDPCPDDMWKRIKEQFNNLRGYTDFVIPDAIKLYIVPKNCKIELYKGDKIEEK